VIKTVGVVGAGTMGNGIAQVFAQSGFRVRLHETRSSRRSIAPARRLKRASPSSSRRAADGRGPQRVDGATPVAASLDDFADADFVVEAVVEQFGHQAAGAPASRCRRSTRRRSAPTPR
jgi:3-hydroxybutyryl-CoA dehydrogenase